MLPSGSANVARLKYERRCGSRPGDAALARLDVPDVADLDAAADQVVTGGDDVVDDEEQALQRARRHRRRALAELDRRGRAGRVNCTPRVSGLGLKSMSSRQPEALVEGLGAVDVGDGQRRDLEPGREGLGVGGLRRGGVVVSCWAVVMIVPSAVVVD